VMYVAAHARDNCRGSAKSPASGTFVQAAIFPSLTATTARGNARRPIALMVAFERGWWFSASFRGCQ